MINISQNIPQRILTFRPPTPPSLLTPGRRRRQMCDVQ